MEQTRSKVHDFDEESMEFVEGKGYIATCKICGKRALLKRLHPVQPRTLPHMSKKARRKLKESR